MSNATSVNACLAAIGLGVKDLRGCTNVTEEFTIIKKAYFKKILVVHPDKGGDPEEFRNVNTSFELIRSLFERQAVSSFANVTETRRERYHGDDGASQFAQPWEFYYDAAAVEEPPYKVELAKSGRSKCSQRTKSAKRCSPTDPIISKGDIRIGSIDEISGSYGRWVHLACWRVPSRIWLGLPADSRGDNRVAEFEAALAAMNEVQFCGFNGLASDQKTLVVLHAMDKRNWAKQVKTKHRAVVMSTSNNSGRSVTQKSKAQGARDVVHVSMPSSGTTAVSLVGKNSRDGEFFVVPSPGVNGAQSDFLQNKTIVLTGLFPEIGGGSGLNLGKDRLKTMCESFGARVTSSISRKTDILVVGREPGMSKVSKASDMAKCQLISLLDLARSIEGKQELILAPPPEIATFSTGYEGSDRAAISGGSSSASMASKATAARRAPAPKAAKKTAGKKRATKASMGKAKRAKFY